MKSICFFCSYYTGNAMPAYVKFYLQEVKRHFSEVVLVMNEKDVPPEDLVFLTKNDINLRCVVNEGYDFGMYYKMFAVYDVEKYDRVGLINDSCILFKKLDFVFQWIDEEKADYCSLTDTNEISYHLQSYFLIINKRAIPLVKDYFNKNGIIRDFLELVRVYEIGLSVYLLNSGLTIKVYYPVNKNERGNPLYLHTKNLIKKGYPMIKKKIFSLDYYNSDWIGLVTQGFNPYPMPYIRLIKKITGTSFPANIFLGLITSKNLLDKLNFNVKYVRFSLDGFSSRIISKVKMSLIKGIKKLIK